MQSTELPPPTTHLQLLARSQDRSKIPSSEPKRLFRFPYGIPVKYPIHRSFSHPHGLCTYRGFSPTQYRGSGFRMLSRVTVLSIPRSPMSSSSYELALLAKLPPYDHCLCDRGLTSFRGYSYRSFGICNVEPHILRIPDLSIPDMLLAH
jgi:hypothetical protein